MENRKIMSAVNIVVRLPYNALGTRENEVVRRLVWARGSTVCFGGGKQELNRGSAVVDVQAGWLLQTIGH